MGIRMLRRSAPPPDQRPLPVMDYGLLDSAETGP
jgi:hypothetical protein